MKKAIRLVDVAKKAGVGVGTASRVINNHPSVADDKRQRVLAAIDELGYQCNQIARSLKSNTTKTIGVVIPDISNEYFADVVRGVQDVASQQGYTIILSNTDSNTKKEIVAINTLCEKQVDGIIMLSHTASKEMLQCIESHFLPAVLVATSLKHKSIGTVNISNKKAAYDAVCHLAKNGHKKIAMVSGPLFDKEGGLKRQQGYLAALKDFGIKAPKDYLLFGKDYSYKSGYCCMQSLLKAKVLPTAVFFASDYMAIGAIKAAAEKNIGIPKDISVIGFDNLAVCAYYSPSLSTVNQPRYDMGSQSMQLLYSIIKGSPPQQIHLVLPHKVLARQSTREQEIFT